METQTESRTHYSMFTPEGNALVAAKMDLLLDLIRLEIIDAPKRIEKAVTALQNQVLPVHPEVTDTAVREWIWDEITKAANSVGIYN